MYACILNVGITKIEIAMSLTILNADNANVKFYWN
jgi:hypothetical protein